MGPLITKANGISNFNPIGVEVISFTSVGFTVQIGNGPSDSVFLTIINCVVNTVSILTYMASSIGLYMANVIQIMVVDISGNFSMDKYCNK